MASLGMVFGQYADDVVEYVTSPLTGIQRGKIFPPSIAEVVNACDARMAEQARIKRYRNWGKNDPETLAIEGPKNDDRPSYDDLLEKYGPNFGLGQAEEEARAKSVMPAPTADQLRHHYAHYKLAFEPKDRSEAAE